MTGGATCASRLLYIMNDFANLINEIEKYQDVKDLKGFGLSEEEILGYLAFNFDTPPGDLNVKHQRRNNDRVS